MTAVLEAPALATRPQMEAHAAKLAERYPLLQTSDLRNLTDTQRLVIHALQLMGWRGEPRHTGHILMHAPDGVSSTIVGRKSKKGGISTLDWRDVRRWAEAYRAVWPAAETVMTVGQTRELARKSTRRNAFGMPVEPVRSTVIVRPVDAPGGETMTTIPLTEDFTVGEPEAAPRAVPETFLAARQTVTTCPECGREVKGAGPFARHMKSTHGPAEEHPCTVCGQVMTSPGSLARHMRKHEVRDGLVCPRCQHLSPDRAGLLQHLKRSHPEVVDAKVVADHARHKPVAPQEAAQAPVAGPRLPKAPKASRERLEAAQAVSSPFHDVLAEHLAQVPEGEEAEAMVAAIRAVVARPLVDEIRALRTRLAAAETRATEAEKARDEVETKLALLTDAFTALRD